MAAYIGSYTMNVGDTKELYVSDSMWKTLGYSTTHWGSTTWTSSNTSVISITYKQKGQCTIKAVGNGTAKIEYDVFWADAYLNWIDTKDYYNITVEGGKITITASPNGGSVTKGSKVTLTSSPSGANIYYTLDGSTPTTSSNIYTSTGITITNDCTLKAIAKKNGYKDSDVLTVKYTMAPSDGDFFTAKTAEGVEMKFQITDVSAKTCEIASNSIDTKTLGNVTIPQTANGYSVTNIGSKAFFNCSNLSSVIIPNTITDIGDSAFENCSSISSVVIPNSVIILGTHAFYGCSSLESITLSNSLKQLPYAFYGCSSLRTIKGVQNIEYMSGDVFSGTPWKENLPDGINYVGKVLYNYKGIMPANTNINVINGCTQILRGLFEGQEGLVGISIPASLTNDISRMTFDNCTNLQTIIVDAANTVYDSRNNCNALIRTATNTLEIGCSGTTIPTSVTIIGPGAFWSRWTKEEIVVPNQIDSIGPSAFRNLNNVKRILIGKGLRGIHSASFAELPHLKEITVSTSNPYFDSRENCNAIIEKATNTLVIGCSGTIIPNTVKVIGDQAFWAKCDEDFTSLAIPNSIEEIKMFAFANQSYLREISIGANVKKFGESIFHECFNLKAIESLNGFPDDIDEKVFDSGSKDFSFYDNVTLYVPAGCRNNYRLATGWSNFKNIVEGSLLVGVDDVLAPQQKEEFIYSPTGVRLSAPQRGVNIVNGKKLLVK